MIVSVHVCMVLLEMEATIFQQKGSFFIYSILFAQLQKMKHIQFRITAVEIRIISIYKCRLCYKIYKSKRIWAGHGGH